MKRIRFLLASLILAACTQVSAPKDAMDRVNREFGGREANDFFVSYGMPAGSQPAEGGGKLYRWLSLEPQGVNRPAEIITYPGGHFGTIAAGNGEMMSGYCEISIRTDNEDRIQKLSLVYDSTGKFSGSRCAEIFGLPPS